jgi:hypothetical protein
MQALVALARDRQVGAAERRQVGLLEARQAERGAALVRLVDGGDVLGRQLQGSSIARRERAVWGLTVTGCLPRSSADRVVVFAAGGGVAVAQLASKIATLQADPDPALCQVATISVLASDARRTRPNLRRGQVLLARSIARCRIVEQAD